MLTCVLLSSDETAKYAIYNSAGVQIGDNNHMEVGVSLPLLDSTYVNWEEPASKYQYIFGKMLFKDPLSRNLELSYLLRGL